MSPAPSLLKLRVQVTLQCLLGLFTSENQIDWRTKSAAKSELVTKVETQCPLQELLLSRGHFARAAPVPSIEQDWSSCRVSKKVSSCGMCSGCNLMSASNLEFSGKKGRHTATVTFGPSKERLVKLSMWGRR